MAKFSTAIRQAAGSRGWTVAKIAEEVGMNQKTLITCLKRNRFRQSDAVRIACLLGLAHNEKEITDQYELAPSRDGSSFSAERYLNNEPTILDLFSLLDKETTRLTKQMERSVDIYCEAMGRMKSGDLHVVISQTVSPLEMTAGKMGAELRKAIIKAILAGAAFVYLRPDSDEIKWYEEECKFSQMVSLQAARKEFEEFQEQLISGLATDITKETARKRVERSTAQYYVKRHPFWCPGFSFGLLRTFDKHNIGVSRLSIRLPRNAGFIVLHNEFFEARMIKSVQTALNDLANKKHNKNDINQKQSVEIIPEFLAVLGEYRAVSKNDYVI